MLHALTLVCLRPYVCVCLREGMSEEHEMRKGILFSSSSVLDLMNLEMFVLLVFAYRKLNTSPVCVCVPGLPGFSGP